jgi:hypothetical protein
MSKLFKLKEWLTVADAARRLAVAFGEDVTEADVLRLALDARLRLSVHFAGHVKAWPGKINTYGDPTDFVQLPDGANFQTEIGIRLSKTRIMKVEQRLVHLEGLCDLTMIGNEKYHVDEIYRSLAGWPRGRVLSSEGSFLTVHGVEGIYALQREPNEKFSIDLQPLPWHPEGYIPAFGLPTDCVLVVRTEALREFELSVNEPTGKGEQPLTTRERETFLNIIGVMLELLKNPRSGRDSDAAVIKEMLENYGDKPGIKERTLQEKFPAAKKSLMAM